VVAAAAAAVGGGVEVRDEGGDDVVKVLVVVMWLRGGSGSEVVLMRVTSVVGRMLWCRRGGVRRWGWCCSGMEMVETKVRVAVVVW
ncbi:hypothetical protein Tco_0406198, partial [Tanacetum coccineum]